MGQRNASAEVTEEIDRAENLRHQDRRACLALLDRIGHRISFGQDPEAVARVNDLRAQVHADQGDHYLALSALRRARRAWLSMGCQLAALRALLLNARVLQALGEYDESIRMVEEVLDDLVDIAPDPDEEDLVTAIHADAAHVLGDARSGLGDDGEALRQFDIAMNLRHALGDTAGVIAAVISRGRSLLVRGMGHRALDELVRAHRSATTARLEQLALQALVVLAGAVHVLGQVSRGIALLHAIRPRLLELGLRPDLARLDLTLAACQVQAGNAHEGHRLACTAAEEFIALGMFARSGDSLLVAAWASLLQDRMPRAVRELANAEGAFVECGARSELSYVKLTQAEIAERLGENHRALDLAQQLIHPDSVPPPPIVGMRARLLIAALADDEQAERALAGASRTASLLGRRGWRLETLMLRGLRHRRTGDLNRAATDLRRAEHIALAIESESPDLQLPVTVRTPALRVHDELISVLLDQGTHHSRIEAWQWVSLGKSRVLTGVVEPSRGWWFPPGPGETDGWVDHETADALEQLLHGLEQHPARRRTARVERPLLPVPPEEAVLEFHVLEQDVVAFVVREGQVHVRLLHDATAASQALVAAWQHECARRAAMGPDHPCDEPGSWQSILRDLHRVLLDPVSDLVEDLADEVLTIVGHRHLHAVPFDALLGEDGTHLRDRHQLRHVFSLQVGKSGTGDDPDPAPRSHTRRALVLAVPDLNAPQIEVEAKVVASALPHADLRIGEAAVAATFFERPADCDLVHVACHGFFDRENPLHSALRFADRWLTAREIVDADLTGTDVVLSACASGQSADTGGEPTGLAWACLAAGATSVVAPMWPVKDAVTREFMEHLYAGLAAGHAMDESVVRAGSELARTHPHPFHWAAFRHFESDRVGPPR